MRDPIRRPRAIRAVIAALVTALLALTAGCASIPTSGSVNPGLAEAPDQPVDLDVFARGPQPGATQQQILDGFIDAIRRLGLFLQIVQRPRNGGQ